MSRAEPVEAVLFDLDGTLLDHAGAAAAAAAASLPGTDAAYVARRWLELEELVFARYLAGELGFAEQRRVRVTILAAELGLGDWDAARADAWIAAYLERYRDAWRVFPDVAGCLDALESRAVPIGIITNGDGAQQRAKIEGLGLADRFPHVVISGEAGAAKPAAEIFHLACRTIGVAPGRAGYVGDRLTTDALGARAAGMLGVWLDRPGEGGTAGAVPDDPGVPRITTLARLPALLG
ncbi:HAD family hydrolase [Actinomadura viridis]|uniref:Hydrolase of the HAD superfamily n=1 Tax=Actinomadura viridis TaxID=58110 RepID=A0A931DMM6_9ACTN|nr:HAD family hydrolase [Actinomadura viridis]MBG6091449.1 putative hydrolase of the HAD superfamily [Actinomadura viridis]